MKKIPCLFRRIFKGNETLLLDSVSPGCEWVTAGEGIATIKHDGTACAVIKGKLYARYDCKPRKARKKHKDESGWSVNDFKQPPQGAIACQEPDLVTGHWPHWVLVNDDPQYKYHREAFASKSRERVDRVVQDGTYELVGPKINGNKHKMSTHLLIKHGSFRLPFPDRSFESIKKWLSTNAEEGLVFHHNDGNRMAKIRRKDYGFEW